MDPFPYKILEFDEEILQKYPDFKDKFVLVGPKKYCYFADFKNSAQLLYNFEVRPNDVWIFGVPRSGTTLTQELVWLIGNDLNYEKAIQEVLDVRFPVFGQLYDFKTHYERVKNESEKYSEDLLNTLENLVKPASQRLTEMTERRFIKTHLPLSLAPKNLFKSGCKVVYVARNPKDLAVSSFLLTQSFDIIDKNLEFKHYWELFKKGLVFSTPFFEHVKEGWELRNHKNVLFLNYDKSTKDIRKTILQVADFLGKKMTAEEVTTLEDHLKIDNFRQNKSVNNDHLKILGVMESLDNFIRKGKVGSGRQYFAGDMNADADRWIEENLRNTDLNLSINL